MPLLSHPSPFPSPPLSPPLPFPPPRGRGGEGEGGKGGREGKGRLCYKRIKLPVGRAGQGRAKVWMDEGGVSSTSAPPLPLPPLPLPPSGGSAGTHAQTSAAIKRCPMSHNTSQSFVSYSPVAGLRQWSGWVVSLEGLAPWGAPAPQTTRVGRLLLLPVPAPACGSFLGGRQPPNPFNLGRGGPPGCGCVGEGAGPFPRFQSGGRTPH